MYFRLILLIEYEYSLCNTNTINFDRFFLFVLLSCEFIIKYFYSYNQIFNSSNRIFDT